MAQIERPTLSSTNMNLSEDEFIPSPPPIPRSDSSSLSPRCHSPGSPNSDHSARRNQVVVDTDPRTVCFTFGQRKEKLKEECQRIYDETGQKVFIKYVNPSNGFGFWKIYSHCSYAIDQAKNWLEAEEATCVALIKDGTFKRHRGQAPRSPRDNRRDNYNRDGRDGHDGYDRRDRHNGRDNHNGRDRRNGYDSRDRQYDHSDRRNNTRIAKHSSGNRYRRNNNRY